MIDFHTHLAPLLDADAMASDHQVELVDGKYRVDGQSIGPAALYDASELLSYLDNAHLDQAIVSVPPPFYRQGRASKAWAQQVNDGLMSALGGSDRLRPLAYLPLDDPDAAIAEAIRVNDDTRWAGFAGSAGGGSLALSSPELDALWSHLDATGSLVFLHPGHSNDERLDEFYLSNLLGNPVETGVAAAQLVFSDAVARFPRIRFLLAHGGGIVPSLVGRWQRGLETHRPGVNVSAQSPRDAVRCLWADSLTHDAAALALAEQVFGPDHIVLGSDWPFPMGCLDSLQSYSTPEATERIGSSNPETLLHGGKN